MVISRQDFYADHDGTNGFWKFLDFDKNNPIYKFDTFWADKSVYVHIHGPKFGLNGVIFDSSQDDLKSFGKFKNLGKAKKSTYING